MNTQKLSPRLCDVASLVNGGFVADVGTDHAFLPIYLIETGKATRALATDIRRGPLTSAEKNIALHGLSDKIETILTNGLAGLDAYRLDDIVIAGMGGLNIIEILSSSDFIRQNKTHLVLQPMQNMAELRRYLAFAGFRVLRETITVEDEKVYQMMSAVYDGVKRTLSPVEQLLGRYNIEHKNECPREFIALCDRHILSLGARIDGLAVAGADSSAESELLTLIKKEKSQTEEICQT